MTFKHLIYKLGAAPQRSSRLFFTGLIAFVVGLVGVYVSVNFMQTYAVILKWLSLAIMLISFVVAMTGYVGILANRFAQVINLSEPRGGRDK
ncbi:hypothetical protein [Neptunicella marina]|uniref:Uncharacterized protein n=1 Tax=Neptunicella marina TaxID=2125989 RepID=A0A8J6ITC2_9ALTE|nr:hypothetical protein [Neptunicella marina]MBC3765929.1 hypothetical protein [Neptunicella marina]